VHYPPLQILLFFLLLPLSFTSAESGPYVRDVAGLYQRNPEEKAEIETRLVAFSQRHGLPFYLLTQNSVSAMKPIQEQVAEERLRLLGPNRKGFLLLYEMDTGLFSLSTRPHQITTQSIHLDAWPPIQNDIVTQARWKELLQQNIPLADLYETGPNFDPTVACKTLTFSWAQTWDETNPEGAKKTDEWNKLSQKSLLQWIGWIAGILLPCFLLFLGMNRWNRSRHHLDNQTFEFPPPNTKPRLGALHAGGSGVSRQF
jgi:hypothetical protein